MAYFIADVSTNAPQPKKKYLFDANVWLAVLSPGYDNRLIRPYVDFFNRIINETNGIKATIVIPALLLSEIINRMMNDVYYKEFCKTHVPLPHENKHYHFKSVYRPTAQYESDLADVCAAIRDYHRKIEFVSDNLDQYSCRDLIKKIPVHLDVNDYLFSKIALAQGLVIVTNDADFKVEDVHILTNRKELLSLM